MPAAASAAPKVTDLKLTGTFELWLQPKPTTAGESWYGCFLETSKLSYTVATDGKQARINLLPLVRVNGFTLPAQGLFSILNPVSFPVYDGSVEYDAIEAFGDGRVAPSFPAAASGRVSVQAWLGYAQRWNGLNLPVSRPLPTRSAPLVKLQKPAGSCEAAQRGYPVQLY